MKFFKNYQMSENIRLSDWRHQTLKIIPNFLTRFRYDSIHYRILWNNNKDKLNKSFVYFILSVDR